MRYDKSKLQEAVERGKLYFESDEYNHRWANTLISVAQARLDGKLVEVATIEEISKRLKERNYAISDDDCLMYAKALVGSIPAKTMTECPACEGRGRKGGIFNAKCDCCGGSGKIIDCDKCYDKNKCSLYKKGGIALCYCDDTGKPQEGTGDMKYLGKGKFECRHVKEDIIVEDCPVCTLHWYEARVKYLEFSLPKMATKMSDEDIKLYNECGGCICSRLNDPEVVMKDPTKWVIDPKCIYHQMAKKYPANHSIPWNCPTYWDGCNCDRPSKISKSLSDEGIERILPKNDGRWINEFDKKFVGEVRYEAGDCDICLIDPEEKGIDEIKDFINSQISHMRELCISALKERGIM